MSSLHTLFALVLCLVCAGAQAQWQWIDKDGRKVFSDRAPPADIPAKSILRQPGGSSPGASAPAVAAAVAASVAGSGAQPAVDPNSPKLSSVDKDLLEKKKLADAAAAAKVKAEEQRAVKAKAENCERARAGKAMMDSGVRLTVTNSRGEREVLEDAARAAQQKRLQQSIDANCR